MTTAGWSVKIARLDVDGVDVEIRHLSRAGDYAEQDA
jgi:hypothetical protein